MKKIKEQSEDMRSEYKREDFGTMVRGKYAKKAKDSTNIIVLDPDIAEAFPTSEAVNEALRNLINLAKSSVPNQSQNSPKVS